MSTKGDPTPAEVTEITKSIQGITLNQAPKSKPEIYKKSKKYNNHNNYHPKNSPNPPKTYSEVSKSSSKSPQYQQGPSPKPKSTQEFPKWVEKSEVHASPAPRAGISRSTEVPKSPEQSFNRNKQKIDKFKSTEGLLTHEESAAHPHWVCEICELDETNCNCDDYLFSHSAGADPEEMNESFYPADEDVPPGVLSPAGGEPWLCEICEQKQEDCHCDDYFDLEEDHEPLYQQHHPHPPQQQQMSPQNRKNHLRSTSLTSPQPMNAGSGSGGKNICAFYLSGKCRFANQCRDLHPSFDWICPFFLRGNCKFGDNCNLGHINLTLK